MTIADNPSPEYLYHYTSIEALSLILKTKKIKFQRLDKVNDPTEELSRDGKLGKYVFVTCWTSQEQEALPFWYMYGNNKRGVRIRLPIDFFEKYQMQEKFIGSDGITTESGQTFDSLLPEETLLESDYSVANYSASSNRFFPVEYTDDPQILMPSVFQNYEDGTLTVALGAMGKHKPTIWSFEQEWRFRLIIYPFGLRDVNPENPIFVRSAIENKKELPFDAYFLEVCDSAYRVMEITLGPLCTEGDRTIVEALLQKYNPSASLTSSVCKVR